MLDTQICMLILTQKHTKLQTKVLNITYPATKQMANINK